MASKKASVTYTGRSSTGVTAGGTFFHYGVPTECDKALADALCAEQPDSFTTTTKPKRATSESESN